MSNYNINFIFPSSFGLPPITMEVPEENLDSNALTIIGPVLPKVINNDRFLGWGVKNSSVPLIKSDSSVLTAYNTISFNTLISRTNEINVEVEPYWAEENIISLSLNWNDFDDDFSSNQTLPVMFNNSKVDTIAYNNNGVNKIIYNGQEII